MEATGACSPQLLPFGKGERTREGRGGGRRGRKSLALPLWLLLGLGLGLPVLWLGAGHAAQPRLKPVWWPGPVEQPKSCMYFQSMRYHGYLALPSNADEKTAQVVARERASLCAHTRRRRPALMECRQEPEALPRFIIMGTPKGGTTFLTSLLRRHPRVWMRATETHWWDRHPSMSLRDYKEFLTEGAQRPLATMGPPVVGDESPSYLWLWSTRADADDTVLLCMPPVPLQMRCCEVGAAETAGAEHQTRFFVTLRNPTERMGSDFAFRSRTRSAAAREFFTADVFHYYVEQDVQRLEVCCGRQRTKEDVLRTDWLRCAVCMERVTNGMGYARVFVGLYVYHLAYWWRFFPRERFYITTMDRLATAKSNASMIDDILTHAALDPTPTAKEGETTQYANKRPFRMFEKTASLLHDYYAPFNEALAELLGEQYPLEWNNKEKLMASSYVEQLPSMPAFPRGMPDLEAKLAAFQRKPRSFVRLPRQRPHRWRPGRDPS